MTNAVATATFKDTWAGDVPVQLVQRKSTRNGQRVDIYSWAAVSGMVTTGYVPTMYPAKAIGSARRDHRFSDVVAS